MENLVGCGIKDIIITTGPFKDKIKWHVEKNYPDLNVSYTFIVGKFSQWKLFSFIT
jgi:hypothetical protein